MWSDPDLVPFLGVTAHFIVRDEPSGKPTLSLRSALLAFRHLPGSHTGENLALALHKIIKAAGIERRVCFVLFWYHTYA